MYTAEKRAYLGFIPNDQVGFVDRLRKVIQQQKSSQMLRQGQVGTGANPGVPNQGGPNQNLGPVASPQSAQSLSGITNPSGLIVQSNTPGNAPGQQPQQNTMMGVIPGGNAQGGPRLSMPGMMPGTSTQIQTNAGQIRPGQAQGGGPGGPSQGARNNFDHMARQQNLDKIMQLKQTLEQAQQQEAQYKSQLEIMNHMKTQQLQEALLVAQQQEMQYKQQMDIIYQEVRSFQVVKRVQDSQKCTFLALDYFIQLT